MANAFTAGGTAPEEEKKTVNENEEAEAILNYLIDNVVFEHTLEFTKVMFDTHFRSAWREERLEQNHLWVNQGLNIDEYENIYYNMDCKFTLSVYHDFDLKGKIRKKLEEMSKWWAIYPLTSGQGARNRCACGCKRDGICIQKWQTFNFQLMDCQGKWSADVNLSSDFWELDDDEQPWREEPQYADDWHRLKGYREHGVHVQVKPWYAK